MTARSKVAAAAVVATAAVTVGIFGAEAATAPHNAGKGPETTTSAAPASTYSTNASGETFGSAMTANSVADEPDLILAYGTQGQLGYVRKSDFEGPQPTSPAEALSIAANATAHLVPLFDKDGVTVIGQFEVQAPSGHIPTAVPTASASG